MTTSTIAAELIELLGENAVSTELDARQTASKDYAWLSPILTTDLPATVADVVVRPTSSDLVPAIMDIAYRSDTPVTVRGRGTGNYGQAVPFRSGIVLDLSGCSAIRSIEDGIADVEAGVTFAKLEQAAAEHDLEVAVMPSMVGSTIGGFLSGGNQGIGSIENGSIWDGWVVGLDIVGCHEGVATRQVTGDDVSGFLHTYGTAGILTGVKLRLRPLRERTVLFASFGEFGAAALAGRELMDLDPPPRAISVADPGMVPAMTPHAGLVEGTTMLRTAVTYSTIADATATIERNGGSVTADDPTAMSGLFASTYNHATLRAKRVDPSVCAVQVRGWTMIERIDEVLAALPDARIHLDGNNPSTHGKGYSGLLLCSWVDRETLDRGMQAIRDMGILVIDPHTWLLGAHGDTERTRKLATELDPKGLLNPGKIPPPSSDTRAA